MDITQLAEAAAEKFLRYVTYDTQSDEDSDSYPSTAKQLELLRALREELEAMGLDDVGMDDNGYVTATLPATMVPLPSGKAVTGSAWPLKYVNRANT